MQPSGFKHSLIGIPLVIHFWPKNQSRVWALMFSLPIGSLIGFFAMGAVFSVFGGRILDLSDKSNFLACLLGSGYGFTTALVAIMVKGYYKLRT